MAVEERYRTSAKRRREPTHQCILQPGIIAFNLWFKTLHIKPHVVVNFLSLRPHLKTWIIECLLCTVVSYQVGTDVTKKSTDSPAWQRPVYSRVLHSAGWECTQANRQQGCYRQLFVRLCCLRLNLSIVTKPQLVQTTISSNLSNVHFISQSKSL